jgi:hypothetical protein
MLYYDGATIVVDTLEAASGERIIDVWGSAPDDYYAVTHEGVYHYDGTSWTPIMLDGRQVTVVHGVSATEVYFAGGSSGAPKFGTPPDGSTAARPLDVPQTGFLLRYDGDNYTVLASNMNMSVNDVWAVGSNNVFMAGSSENAFALGHYNGSSVAIGTTASSYAANGIWASGDTAVGVGGNGVVASASGH